MLRTLTHKLVAWCLECHWFLPDDEIGTSCPGEDHETKSGERILRKRWMWICSNCPGGFFDHQAVKDHVCGEFD